MDFNFGTLCQSYIASIQVYANSVLDIDSDFVSVLAM